MPTFSARSGPLLAFLLAVACGSNDDTGPGAGGTLELTTTTTGSEADSDGYAVIVDGSPHGTIGSNDHVTVSDVGEGSHTVELAQIQFNCATLGAFSRPVTISASAGASVDYEVQCDAGARSRIAYSSPNDSFATPEIVVANADGSDPMSLTDLLGAVRVRDGQQPVAWSGDGQKVAFTRADSALYVANADGTGEVQIAPEGFSPLWTRDGQKVAFRVHEPPAGNPCCAFSNVFVATPGGAGPIQVTQEPDLVFYDFAPSGGTVAYEHGGTSQVVTVKDDGTGVTPITDPDICCLQRPSLSPDGSQVAYYAYPENQEFGTIGYDVYVSPTNGSAPPVDVSNNLGDDWSPAWSPDGTRIAFVNSPAGSFFGPGSLHVVDVDGSNQLNVTPNDVVTEPTWSPDGTRIAYTGYVSCDPHVYVANADGSGRVDITPSRPSSRPTWTGR
ncbi:MAG: hypothetical protein ACJ8DC_11815 [Gemmatimonadales bacterium]